MGISGCGSMVECSLRVREIPGSTPGTPTKMHYEANIVWV